MLVVDVACRNLGWHLNVHSSNLLMDIRPPGSSSPIPNMDLLMDTIYFRDKGNIEIGLITYH